MKLHHILPYTVAVGYIALTLNACSVKSDLDDHDHVVESGHNHEEEGHNHQHDENNSGKADPGNEIVFSSEKAKVAGVKTSIVTPGKFNEVIMTSGRILPSSGDMATIAATRTGIIKMSQAWNVGMHVAYGTPLFSISASELPDGDPAAKIRVEYAKAKADYQRSETLYKEHLISASEYQNAKTAYESAAIAYEALGADSKAGGVVRSSINGYIKECFVSNGQYVNVGEPLMTISANRHLRLQADLPQREYSRISQINSANFRISQSDEVLSLENLNGRVISRGRSSENSGAFIPVIFEFDNSAGIPEGVFAEVYLLGSPRNDVISVPKSALTEEQGAYYVYIREDEDCYSKRNVRIGKSDGERIEITEGLAGGENIVVEGTVHVRLASVSTSIPGHTHNH